MQHISASGSQTLPAWAGNRRGLEITFCLIPGSYEQERHRAPACLSASIPSAEYWLCFLEVGPAVICLPPHFPFPTSGCISLIHTHTDTHTHTFIYIYMAGTWEYIFIYMACTGEYICIWHSYEYIHIYIYIYIYIMNDLFVLCACTIYMHLHIFMISVECYFVLLLYIERWL